MEKRQSEKKGTPPQHEDLDVVPTKETNRSHKSQKSTASSKKAPQQQAPYRADRVKSSIPKAAPV